MDRTRLLTIYADRQTRQRAEAGRHNFLSQVTGAFARRGWQVDICGDSDAELLRARTRPGKALFHMLHPTTADGLVFRKAYVFPFWKIERTGTRWEFDCARLAFGGAAVPDDQAERFVARTRKRELPWAQGVTPRDEVIYVPLQGRLLERRAHQSMSPVEMVRVTAGFFRDTPLRVTLHPREANLSEERAALADAIRGHPDATVGETGPETLLPRAKLVVTQNSSLAFLGMFLRRPAVLFARADFHHILPSALKEDPEAAFEAALHRALPFDAYLHWFLQENAINAGRDDVQGRIVGRAEALGWSL